MKLEKKLAILLFIMGLVFIVYPSFRTGYFLGIEIDERANYCYDSSFPTEGIECAIYSALLTTFESTLYLYRLIGITFLLTSLILFFDKKK